jgi:hypothetical protein
MILEIDTPQEIIKNYPKNIYAVKADNMYALIKFLNNYEHHYSVYPFGEFVHYTDKRADFNPKKLYRELEESGLKKIFIQLTQATIEDTFMELAK